MKSKKKIKLENKKRCSSGITLIGLVVTIIVLLILAGISIQSLVGENGIINKAISAKERTETAEKKELDILKQYEDLIDGVKTLSGSEEILIDENWKISKDINTKTSKVNIYLESIYYKPSFKEYFVRKFVIDMMLENEYGIAFFDSTDASDFFYDLTSAEAEEGELENLDRNDFEKAILEGFCNEMFPNISDDLTDEEQKSQIRAKLESSEDSQENINLLMDYLDKIEREYDSKYAIVEEVPEELLDKTYTIIMPDGKTKNLLGSEIKRNRVRYPAIQNGNYSIVIISTNLNNAYNIQIENIGNYKIEIGDYIYTYNCIADFPIFNVEGMEEIDFTKYRLNFGGWNARVKDNTKSSYEPVLKEVNGEPVTAMCATYADCQNLYGFTEAELENFDGRTVGVNELYEKLDLEIPDTITNMMFTFADTKILVSPVIPETVKNIYEPYSGCYNLKITSYEHLSGNKLYYWITSNGGVKNNLQAIYLLDDSAMIFNEDRLNEKIKKWHYNTNGKFEATEEVTIDFFSPS